MSGPSEPGREAADAGKGGAGELRADTPGELRADTPGELALAPGAPVPGVLGRVGPTAAPDEVSGSSMLARRIQPRDVVRRRVLIVVLTAGGTLATVPLKAALNAWAGADVGFIPAVSAAVVAASIGGLLPGLLATALGAFLEAVWFMPPIGALAVADEGDRMRLLLFCLVGLLVSWLAWVRAKAEVRAHDARAAALEERDRADLANRRLEALQLLATDLAGTVDTARITGLVLERGIAALRADGAAVFLVEDGGEALQSLAWTGYGGDRSGPFERMPIDAPLPATEVARTGEPIFIEEPATYLERYGAEFRRRGGNPAPVSVAVVPLAIEGARFGALGFSWNGHHDLPPDRRVFIAALARLGAAALERGRLFDAETTARRRAEASKGRLDLLVDASRALALSLDYEAVLRRLAGLALPLLGDVGIVDVTTSDVARRLVATAVPELAGPAAVIEAHPFDPSVEGPIGDARFGDSVVVVPLDAESSFAAGRTPEHGAAIRAVGARWALVARIRIQDRTIGTLALLRRAARPYDEEEIAIAEELGERAGRALENARLHSEIARLAQREQRHSAELEAVIASIGEGILVLDGLGRIRSSNAAAIRLLSGTATTLEEVLEQLERPDGHRPALLERGPAEYRLAARPAGWVEVAAYPIAAGAGSQAPSTVIICRDVTAFRQGQALREAFLGLLSHELRTPVTTIYGGASVLTRPGSGLDAPARAEILADIAGEADRLFRLVEDLLVLARFDEGLELGDEPTLLQRLVPMVVDQERGRWPAIRFDLAVAPDLPVVRGDETSVAQVLRNLLSNAAKYSDPGGVVTVTVHAVGDRVETRVSDQGRGIDPAEVEDLFDPFYRSPSTARMAGGAGIGLYVTRRLVDAMGGRIWAAPRPDRGSDFAFVLRRYEADGED